MKIGNLIFIDGILDDRYILKSVRNKQNIFSEISSLKSALKPFKEYLKNQEHVLESDLPIFHTAFTVKYSFSSSKAKFFYDCLIKNKSEKPLQQQKYWCDQLGMDNLEFENIYKINICQIKDKKIAEFKFKILHNVLPCNVNLAKWKKKPNGLCNTCGELETIEHLLFKCVYVEKVWNPFSLLTDFTVNLSDIIIGVEFNNAMSFVISLVAYLIYKDWLQYSLNDSPRPPSIDINSLKCDLISKYAIYNQLKWTKISAIIHLLI